MQSVPRAMPRVYETAAHNTVPRAIPQMILALMFALGVAGCEAGYLEETALFEEAEARYARGDYDGASALYRSFLELHPLSPLADIAEQRLGTVERELDAIMGRRGAPAPIYVPPVGAPAAAAVEGDGFAPVEAPEIPTFGR